MQFYNRRNGLANLPNRPFQARAASLDAGVNDRWRSRRCARPTLPLAAGP